MLCIRPFRKPKVEFGCGQCLPCRINRKRTWAARVMLESLAFRESCFVTLTYNDASLPSDGALSKEHWREFTKGVGYRYFGCGEYGENFGRPHYHLVLFGLSSVAGEQLAVSRWPYGFVSVSPFSFEHAGYVAAYTVKKMTSAVDPRLDGRTPEFAQMSRRPAIGQSGLDWIVSWLHTSAGCAWMAKTLDVPHTVRVNGSLYPLGRTMVKYLREQCDIPSDLPARTMRREEKHLAEQSLPALVQLKERRRSAQYQRLKALNARRRGVL